LDKTGPSENVHEDNKEAPLENAPEMPTLDMPANLPPGTAIGSFSDLCGKNAHCVSFEGIVSQTQETTVIVSCI